MNTPTHIYMSGEFNFRRFSSVVMNSSELPRKERRLTEEERSEELYRYTRLLNKALTKANIECVHQYSWPGEYVIYLYLRTPYEPNFNVNHFQIKIQECVPLNFTVLLRTLNDEQLNYSADALSAFNRVQHKEDNG